MPLASWAAMEARIEVLIAEIILLSIVGYFYFVRPAGRLNPSSELSSFTTQKTRDLEEKMKQCC